MNYIAEFQKLIDSSEQNNQYVGLGNPDAKILFIGKEAGIKDSSELYHGMWQSWKSKECDYSKRHIPVDEKIQNGNHTWQKYQKLFELIFSDQLDNNEIKEKCNSEITFVENIFTTELSNLGAKTTGEAKKFTNFPYELKSRKEQFWTSDYFMQFPIILIFASDNQYIETYQGEVCELFDVEFHEQRNCAKSDKYWIHYAKKNKNKVYPRLLIHTRQLTNGASNELIESIAIEVKRFVKENSLKIQVK